QRRRWPGRVARCRRSAGGGKVGRDGHRVPSDAAPGFLQSRSREGADPGDDQEPRRQVRASAKYAIAVVTPDGVRRIESIIYRTGCASGRRGATPWTWCLNMPCTVTPAIPKKAMCACDLVRTGGEEDTARGSFNNPPRKPP